MVDLTGPGRPGSVEVSGDAARLRFGDDSGAVTTEFTDTPPSLANRPLVCLASCRMAIQVAGGWSSRACRDIMRQDISK